MKQAPLSVLDRALAFLKRGFSIVPIKPDGSKKPTIAWKEFQTRLMTETEARRHFSNGVGIGAVCGKVSGGLEALDFEELLAFEEWKETVKRERPDLLAKLPGLLTPGGGRHEWLRSGAPEGGMKLARSIDTSRGKEGLLVESRGEGNYVVTLGSPAVCHESGKVYEHDSSTPSLLLTPTITIEERDFLFHAARALNEVEEKPRDCPPPREEPGATGGTLRPGDDYNRRATWPGVLEPHGWRIDHVGQDGLTYWTRPGKDRGTSATTGARRECGGADLLHVFTSNAPPLKVDESYSRFCAFAVLEHGGDFAKAAAALKARGYGRETEGARGPGGAKPAEEDGEEETTKEQSAPYRPFPADAVPGLTSDGVKRKLKALGLDSAYIGVPLIASYAGVIGNTRSIRAPGWTEPACLRTGVVANPGGAKSPAWKYALEPLQEIQRRAFRDFKKLKAEHAAEMHKHKVRFGNWERGARKTPVPDSPPEEPEEPSPRRCLVSDTTAEKLVCIHEKNPRGLLVAREELGGFLGSLDAHKKGESDAAFWNESYDGGASIVDRKSDGTHFSARACVSVTGTIQPKALTRLLNQRLFDCGFAQRFVFAMPPDAPARELATEEDKTGAHPLAALFGELHALQPALPAAGDDEEDEFEPIELRLTDDARREFAAWYKRHEQQRVQLSGAIREFHAKNAGRALRIILVVHVVAEVAAGRAATVPVSVKAVRDGLRLADWFAYEARRVYRMLGQLDEKAEGAEDLALLAWIRGWITEGRKAPTARDTQRNYTPLKGGSVDEAEKALRRLSRLGHVYPQVDGQAERFLPFEVSDGDAHPKNPEKYEEASPSPESNGENRRQEEPHPREPGEEESEEVEWSA